MAGRRARRGSPVSSAVSSPVARRRARRGAAVTVLAEPPRLAVVLRLFAGRGAFRLSAQFMAVALLAVWSPTDYGHYATAVGLWAWLLFLPTAAEKTALKLIPRTRLIRASVARWCLALAAAPFLAALAALVVALAVAPGPGGAVVLHLAAIAWSSGTGLLMAVSGLHRLRGHPGLDTAVFTGTAAVVLGATALTAAVGWGPGNHLLVLVGGLALLAAGTTAALPPSWRRPDPATTRAGTAEPRRLLPAIGRTTTLLGLPELLDAASLSTVFLVLAAVGRGTDNGRLYLALLATAAVNMLVVYQFKLHQPSTSMRLRGTGARAGRARAVTVLHAAERVGLGVAVVVALVLLVPGARHAVSADDGRWPLLALAVLVVVDVVVSIGVNYASYLLENSNSRALRITSLGSLAGLVATAVLAVALAPPLGALGGFTAIMLATAVHAGALRRMLLRRHPELAQPRS